MTSVPLQAPKPGTDAERLLLDMLECHPTPSWSPNSRLVLTAHSRASDLRKLGWKVKAMSTPSTTAHAGRARRIHGYAFVELPSVEAAPSSVLVSVLEAHVRAAMQEAV